MNKEYYRLMVQGTRPGEVDADTLWYLVAQFLKEYLPPGVDFRVEVVGPFEEAGDTELIFDEEKSPITYHTLDELND